MQPAQPNTVVILVSVVVIGLGLFLRVRRMTAKRPLKPATLWIVPAIFVGIAALNFAEFPPTGSTGCGSALRWCSARVWDGSGAA